MASEWQSVLLDPLIKHVAEIDWKMEKDMELSKWLGTTGQPGGLTQIPVVTDDSQKNRDISPSPSTSTAQSDTSTEPASDWSFFSTPSGSGSGRTVSGISRQGRRSSTFDGLSSIAAKLSGEKPTRRQSIGGEVKKAPRSSKEKTCAGCFSKCDVSESTCQICGKDFQVDLFFRQEMSSSFDQKEKKCACCGSMADPSEVACQICGDSFPPRQREAAPVVMVPFSIADKKPMTWDRSELAIRIPGGGKRKVALPMLRNGDEGPTITTPVRKLLF